MIGLRKATSRGGKERTRVTDRFDVEKDAVRVGIAAEIVDQVSPADVEHGAGGNHGAEADFFFEAPIEDGGFQRPALAEEGYVSRQRHVVSERGVQAGEGSHDSQAVRSDDAHAVASPLAPAHLLLNLLLELRAFGSTFLKARGDHHGGAHPCVNAFADYAWDEGGGRDDHGQIDFFGDGADRLVAV